MRRPTVRLAMVAALIWFGSGWLEQARAAGVVLSTPAGLTPGDQFRFVFVTDATTTALSVNITDYDSFVQSQAGGATYDGATVTWLAIGSTSVVDAIDHIGQTNTPVYLVDGTEVTTSTTPSGLWSGTIMNPIDEDISGSIVSSDVWTGTHSNGDGAAVYLGSPSPASGSSSLTGSGWVANAVTNESDDLSRTPSAVS